VTPAWLTEARRRHIDQLEHEVLPTMERALDDMERDHPTPGLLAEIDQHRAWCRQQRTNVVRWTERYL
jgi:hypothetical protein